MIVRLLRTSTSKDGTFGTLVGMDFDFYSLELPWLDANGDGLGDPQKSCITPGTYECAWRTSPKYGPCFEVTGVEGRSHILIHPANWASQLLGCIALGKGRGVLNGKPAITQSKQAIKEFHEAMREQNFTLEIAWAQ